jgi:hypothetical protein
MRDVALPRRTDDAEGRADAINTGAVSADARCNWTAAEDRVKAVLAADRKAPRAARLVAGKPLR